MMQQVKTVWDQCSDGVVHWISVIIFTYLYVRSLCRYGAIRILVLGLDPLLTLFSPLHGLVNKLNLVDKTSLELRTYSTVRLSFFPITTHIDDTKLIFDERNQLIQLQTSRIIYLLYVSGLSLEKVWFHSGLDGCTKKLNVISWNLMWRRKESWYLTNRRDLPGAHFVLAINNFNICNLYAASSLKLRWCCTIQ